MGAGCTGACSPGFQALSPACRYRTGKLLFTLAQRLRKHTAQLGAFEAWNKCLSHVLALARAHVEAVMFERFQDAVVACPDADCRKSLQARRWNLNWGSLVD